MSYDIIGDVHGHAEALVGLLQELGYRERNGAWRHASRTAVFVGDFIDRGPKQVETVRLVRRMVDAGSALAVMGNHELNAMAWYTPDPESPGGYLRPHNDKNRKQHARFLAEVEGTPLHAELVGWFAQLPLWLELPALRVVHACWHPALMEFLAPQLLEGRRLGEALLPEATREPADSSEAGVFEAVEILLKGLEAPLPSGLSYLDKDGHRRTRVRLRWWDPQPASFREAAIVPEADRAGLPATEVPAHARLGYEGDRPVFFGHYWMTGTPAPQLERAACVDYSIGNGGRLCAYRYEGEPALVAERFVSVGPNGR